MTAAQRVAWTFCQIDGRLATRNVDAKPREIESRKLMPDGLTGRAGNHTAQEEALAAIEEAVTIRRELARARPTVFASSYVSSLRTRAMILSALGRSAEAQAARDEAAASSTK
jgi:hypothetical protein